MQDLRISEASFYYHYKKYQRHSITLKQLFDHYDQKNFHLATDPFEVVPSQEPELLVVVSPLMRKNYAKYGASQFMAFDMTFNLFRQSHHSGQKFKLGCFMGLSSTRKLVPFGLVVSVDETKDRYSQIYRTFLQLMDQQPPSCVITD